MNSKNDHATNFKKPISRSTHAEIFDFFNEAIEYIEHLKLSKSGPSILLTGKKTGFLGFTININSFKQLYFDYVETGLLKSLITFQFSQDHLELLFACIRSANGCNNNPTALQFESAYKRLMLHNSIKASAAANIQESNINILTVSSRRDKLVNTSIYECVPENLANVQEIENFDVTDYQVFEEITAGIDDNSIKTHAVVYLSSVVESKVMHEVKCIDCLNAIADDDITENTLISRKIFSENIHQPSVSVVKICKVVEHFLKMEKFKVEEENTATKISKIEFEKVERKAMNGMKLNELFTDVL